MFRISRTFAEWGTGWASDRIAIESAGVAPLACAVANFVAVVVMAVILAPGTPIVSDVAERERYIGEHLLAWRLGWATWMVARFLEWASA